MYLLPLTVNKDVYKMYIIIVIVLPDSGGGYSPMVVRLWRQPLSVGARTNVSNWCDVSPCFMALLVSAARALSKLRGNLLPYRHKQTGGICI